MILDRIVASTRQRVAREKAEISLAEIKAQALALPISPGFPFEDALCQQDFNFICEVKKASPSKGIIAEDFPYLAVAKEYEEAGAAAISCLTEPEFFKGDKKYLQEIAQAVSIPVLRKDFIIDAYQIYQAKIWGASAVLLICACLDEDSLTRFRLLAESLGLSALVEAHDEEEIRMAVRSGARIIGVNNRNLKDFTVDVNNSIRLRQLVDDQVIFVSESGLTTPEDIQTLRDHNIRVALMGESFMRAPNKVEQLAYLYGPLGYQPKVKICGISQEETLPALLEAKPDYMGLVFAPSKRQVSLEKAKFLVTELRTLEALHNGKGQASSQDEEEALNHSGRIGVAGVFVNESLEKLLEIAKEVPLDIIQLHGDEDETFIRDLKEALNQTGEEDSTGAALRGPIEIWKAVSVQGTEDTEAWLGSVADMILFDTYHQGERGGTGQVFDWQALDDFDRPFILAGGLSLKNIARAIRTVRPHGIDISSGLETEGHKDNDKIGAFSHLLKAITR